MIRHSWSPCLLSLVSSQLLHAASLEELRACAAIANATQRLACYDREVAKLSNAAEPLPPVNVQQLEQEFGVRGSELARQRSREEPKLERLSTRVSAIDKRPRGELVIHMQNGQIWQQIEPTSHFPLQVGYEVTIKASALSSHLLIAPSGKSTRVRRVQ